MIRHRSIRGESHVDFLGESEGSPPPPPQDSLPGAGEAINDFWSMSGNIIYRHHVEPRVKLYSPREESFPFPLKCIDVSRTTHTNLDVKQERLINDHWSIGGSRDLSDPWTGFTQFTLLEEKAPEGDMWSGVRLTRKQLTSRPDHLWPELWEKMGKNAKLKERQKWSHEKNLILIMLENFEEFISLTLRTRNLRRLSRMLARNWKHQWLPLCLARSARTIRIVGMVINPIKSNLNLSVFWKPVNLQGCVWENHYQIIMKTILQQKETIHYSIKIWFIILFVCLKLRKFLQQRQQWTRNGKTWRKFRRRLLTKVRSKKEVIDEARTTGSKVHFASLMDMCHLKNVELEAKHQKYKGRVVLRGDIVKRRFRVFCSIHRTRIFSISNDSS